MSLRLFKSFNNDSSSDYLQKKCDAEKIRLNKSRNQIDISNACYKIGLCDTTTIKDYNTLQKYSTFYNIYKNNNYDSTGTRINYFNGQINQNNYLSYNASSSICSFKYLDPSLNSGLSCNYITPYEYGTINSNNLLYIDISGKISPNRCSNLFYKNNENVKYSIDISNLYVSNLDVSNIPQELDNKLVLYDPSCNKYLIK